ncbi:hypothetical protein [Allobranchiibius sp. GilTou38]|uniref:hypothetical protein n=1 Tax=Allobranchiibius sp. GilTou38 TaxID=2815210 RepID=UPI001AA110E4|nr:hypothetical protein [Allobranchiibius sp. GilTou38]MBO1767411.1 hypothetical protein [Allobranchiibius sp. GilTou38]
MSVPLHFSKPGGGAVAGAGVDAVLDEELLLDPDEEVGGEVELPLGDGVLVTVRVITGVTAVLGWVRWPRRIMNPTTAIASTDALITTQGSTMLAPRGGGGEPTIRPS